MSISSRGIVISTKDNKASAAAASQIQVAHTSAALQSEKLAQYGLLSGNAAGKGSVDNKQKQQFIITKKSAFTRNLEAVHDRQFGGTGSGTGSRTAFAGARMSTGGNFVVGLSSASAVGNYEQPNFTAHEAELGRQRVKKSMVSASRTITSATPALSKQQQMEGVEHHGSSFGAMIESGSASVVKTAAGPSSNHTMNKNRHGGLPLGGGGAPKATNKTNFAQMTRERCIGEDQQADRHNFEKRVQEIMTMRNTGNVLNARVVETWINETLSDAEHLEIPGVVLKPTQKDPLARYKVDRLKLISENVDVASVDRIYWGLFVYSIGFYEMLFRALKHSKNKYTILSSIWKVYSILLEYCCRSGYQMQLAQMHTEHQEALDKMEEDFKFELSQMNATEKDLKLELDDLQKENSDLHRRLDDEVQLRIKLQEEIYKNIRSHEEEVQLRLQFESKLNGLHSLHRDLQAKYERALDDIYRLELTSKAVQEKYDKVETEVITLRSLKIEHEARISYNEEKIRSLNVDIEQKVRAYQTIEAKLLKAQETIEEKNLLIKDQEQRMDQLALIQESERALINGLRSEKTHLELQLKENTALKEQYMMKNNQVQEKYEALFQESQQYKRNIVGVEEIKKDRDARVNALRTEIDQLQAQLDKLTSDHAALKVHAKSVQDAYARLQASHNTIENNLQLANEVRLQAEQSLTELQAQYRTVKQAFLDKEEMLNIYKRKFEEEQNKLTQIERKADTLEIEKKSLEKQNDIQRKQLLDKINQQTELIAAEKDTREIWINRYEKEQKNHIKTHADFMQMRGEMQEMTLKYENQRTIAESLESIKNSLKKSHEELQEKYTGSLAECEKLKRELYTNQKLLGAQKQMHEQYVKDLKEEKTEIETKHQEELAVHQMEYEDLRTQAVLLCEKIVELEQNIEDLKRELAEMTMRKEDLQNRLTKKEWDYDVLMKKFEDKCEELSNEKEAHQAQIKENERLSEEIKENKRQICDQLERISDLKTSISELEEQNDEHLQTIKTQKEAIEQLEERIRNKKERYDVQIQTGFKTKSRKIQTNLDKEAAMASFGHGSVEGGLNFIDHNQLQQHPGYIKHSSQTDVFGRGAQDVDDASNDLRPRVHSANINNAAKGSDGNYPNGSETSNSSIILLPQQHQMQDKQQWQNQIGSPNLMTAPDIQMPSSTGGAVQQHPQVRKRPTKSAGAYNKKYHQGYQPMVMTSQAGAIAEEIDYEMSNQQQQQMMMHQQQQQKRQLKSSGGQRSTVLRLKDNKGGLSSQEDQLADRLTQYTVASQGAGVLLGNTRHFLNQTGGFIGDHSSSLLQRELANESKVSVGGGGVAQNASNHLKSVYHMRVSHSNLSAAAATAAHKTKRRGATATNHYAAAGAQSRGDGRRHPASPTPNQSKRKHLQSAALAKSPRLPGTTSALLLDENDAEKARHLNRMKNTGTSFSQTRGKAGDSGYHQLYQNLQKHDQAALLQASSALSQQQATQPYSKQHKRGMLAGGIGGVPTQKYRDSQFSPGGSHSGSGGRGAGGSASPPRGSLNIAASMRMSSDAISLNHQKKMTYISHGMLPATGVQHLRQNQAQNQNQFKPPRKVGTATGANVTAASSSRNPLLDSSFIMNTKNLVTGDMDLQVKGKSSIRTLIRLANSRALSDRDRQDSRSARNSVPPTAVPEENNRKKQASGANKPPTLKFTYDDRTYSRSNINTDETRKNASMSSTNAAQKKKGTSGTRKQSSDRV